MKRFSCVLAGLVFIALAPQAQDIRSFTTVGTEAGGETPELLEMDQAFAFTLNRDWAVTVGGEYAGPLSGAFFPNPIRGGARLGAVRVLSRSVYAEASVGFLSYYPDDEPVVSNLIVESALNVEKASWYLCLRDKITGNADTVIQVLSITASWYPDDLFRINAKGSSVVDPETGVSPLLRLDGHIAPIPTWRALGIGLGCQGELFAKTEIAGGGYGRESTIFGYLLWAPHFGTGISFSAERHFGDRNDGLWELETVIRYPFLEY